MFSILFQDIPFGKDPSDHGATDIVKMEGGKQSIEVNNNFLSYILFLFQNFIFAVQNACREVTGTLEREEVNQNQSEEVNQALEEKTLK